MSDYRDPYTRDPMDPTRTREPLDPTASPTLRDSPRRNSGLGWIAGAVFVVIVVALIFGLGRNAGDKTANNGANPPVPTTGAEPSGGATTAPWMTTGQSSSQ